MNYQLVRCGVVLLSSLLCACTQHQVIRANATPAVTAERDIAEDQLLDVGIAILDPGLSEDESPAEEGVFPELRAAEARYIPYALKMTLEGTGNWGAVRVLPAGASMDLIVGGEILASDGEVLTVNIRVRDATGRIWLDKQYTHTASKFSYSDPHLADEDPFQDIYNLIANDMLDARNRLSPTDFQHIRATSELRFAADISPDIFADYLSETEQGQYVANRLPADDDPMMGRVRKIRDRDEMLADTLNEHYAAFYRDMEQPYRDWRNSSYEEVRTLRELRSSARKQKLLGAAAAVVGVVGLTQSDSNLGQALGAGSVAAGAAVFKEGMDRSAEAEIHVEAIRELGSSFEAQIAPMVVEVEGRTLTLSGSAEDQYEEWRRLLRKIHATETGFVGTDEEGLGAGADGATPD